MLLHAALNIVVVQVRGLSVVLGAGIKTAPMQSIQQLVQHLHAPLQGTDDILEIEQELLCDDSLRRECGEELVGR